MLNCKTLLTLSAMTLFLSSAGSALAADKTSKYRVFQDDRLLYETSEYKTAEAYAKQFASSHVEEIGSRSWLWNNYPRYKVYQNGYSNSQWEFASLDQAIREASMWGHASVRDLQSGGWVWNNYPAFRVYQGEITLDSWEFPTLEQAIAEARRWSEAHVISLNDHRWVWDNISAARKAELKEGPKTYQVYQGDYTKDDWKFASLEDAIAESLNWGNSSIRNTDTGRIVLSNVKPYKVYQYDTSLDSFLSLDSAIAYAKQYSHTKIMSDEAPLIGGLSKNIWNNYPYYQVYQNQYWIADFSTIGSALNYAMGYANASIRLFDDGSSIWNNMRRLQFWGWNGSSSDGTVRGHVNNTRGLDVVSPTYFQLADSAGNLTDSSNKETVGWLKQQGYAVHPLVSNQFDPQLTTAFLSSAPARTKFINALVSKASSLGVDGLNIDFESVNGKDRSSFTDFMKELTETAHAKGLVISIDLPRGSVRWNAQTAFDHEKLGQMVDYIITMAYDQYYKGSTEPGSVSGLSWAEEGVKEFLAYGIPRDKLVLGIPFYVREWKVDAAGGLVDNRALLMKDLPALIASKTAVQSWDPRFNQYKVEYEQDGYKNVFWLENEDTVKARIELAKKYDLAGVAAWRLGYDPASLWNMMLQEK